MSRLLAAEKALFAMIALSAALFICLGISPVFAWQVYYPQIPVSVVAYLIGLFIAYLVLMCVHSLEARQRGAKLSERELLRIFNQHYLTSRSLLLDLRLVNAVMLMFALFAYQKHLIPLVNGRLFDAWLLEPERKLLSVSFTEFFIETLGPQAHHILSKFYTAFYVYVPVTLFVMVLQRKNRTWSDEFCAAFVLCWLIGTLSIYLFPTWGPCFFAPQTIAALPQDTEIARLQSTLWHWKEYLDQHPGSTEKIFAISGLPSLHMAVAILGSIYLRRVNFVLECCSWLFALGTFVATIYFGWHYLADNLAALLIVAPCIFMARLLVRNSVLRSG